MSHVFYTPPYGRSVKKNNQQDPRLDDQIKQYQRLLAEGKPCPRSAFGARVAKLKKIERHHKKRLLT